MKLTPFLLLSLTLSQTALADRIQSRVHSIIYSDDSRPHILRMENGRAILIKDDLLMTMTQKASSVSALQVETDKNNLATSIKKIALPFTGFNQLKSLEEVNAEPTVVANLSEAEKIFNRLNPNYNRKSECTNRAHVWSYEEFTKNNIVMTKSWIFFTANYIRDYNFIWWFHVAPTIAVNNNGTIEKRVMDYRYMDRPVLIDEWRDLLVYSKKPCIVTTKFSEYDFNPHIDHCYYMFSNMYYWMPQDFKNEEATGTVKSNWNMGEVKAAYSEAF